MKHSLMIATILFTTTLLANPTELEKTKGEVDSLKKELGSVKNQLNYVEKKAADDARDQLLAKNSKITINVVGQGVAPLNTSSPAQAYALAKRAAIADAYRALAEKLKGVRVEGEDVIRNMMIQKSTIKTQVDAMIRDANIVETAFKDGLCEVEMEMTLLHSDFVR